MIIFDRMYKVNPHRLIDDLGKKFGFRGMDDKKVKNQYFLCCPFHAGGKEKTASANFSLVDRGRTKEGDFYCFACKAKGHISYILSRLFGDKKLAQDWVERMYGNLKGLVEEKRELRKIEIKGSQVEPEKQIFDLDEEAYIDETSYYEKRGIPDELVKRFKLGYIDKRKAVYMPVFNNVGEVVFYMTRNIHDKKFYLPKGAKKVLWGANEIKGGEVVVCESIFNALTCYKYGHQAVALFGTGSDDEYPQLLALPARSFIIALDNDEAGQKGTKVLIEILKKAGRLVSTVTIDVPHTDLNDYAGLTQEEFDLKWYSWLRRNV